MMMIRIDFPFFHFFRLLWQNVDEKVLFDNALRFKWNLATSQSLPRCYALIEKKNTDRFTEAEKIEFLWKCVK